MLCRFYYVTYSQEADEESELVLNGTRSHKYYYKRPSATQIRMLEMNEKRIHEGESTAFWEYRQGVIIMNREEHE